MWTIHNAQGEIISDVSLSKDMSLGTQQKIQSNEAAALWEISMQNPL